MQPFRFHVFVCDQQKPEGLPCCAARGGARIIESLRREVHMRWLDGEVQVTACGSLGLCEHGPNLVVYPEGTWYSGVTVADIPELVNSHFLGGTPVERLVHKNLEALRSEIAGNREKMLAARRAREAAGVLPDELNDRIRAFQESRVVLTALELDVFTVVGDGAGTAEVAEKLHTDHRATEMLLNALASLHLLVKQNGLFHNSPEAARYFSSSSRDNARPALLHSAHLWPRWSTLTECVRAGTAVSGGEAAGRGEDWTEAFIAAMHRNASERAPLVVRAVGAENVRHMLDVGGGSGAYSIAFAQSNPALRAEILDLATVEPIALRHIRAAGVEDRVKVRVGDLRSGNFGEGHDLVFLSAICHMLSPAENLALLRRCHEALVAGGRVVIQDFILEADKTAPRFAALFALNMLVGTPGGSSYSETEFAAWLAGAGFREIRHVRLPGTTGLMLASR
jgi:(2Fe-2S) ferredoxin/ribosomal protein L11 methylase PrmA